MYDQEYVRVPKYLMNEVRRAALKSDVPLSTFVQQSLESSINLEQQAEEERVMTRYEKGLEIA